MRYLRKESVYIFEQTKLILPTCFKNISNFNGGMNQQITITTNGASIMISSDKNFSNATIGNLENPDIIEIPIDILNAATLLDTKFATIYLLNPDTIEITATTPPPEHDKTDNNHFFQIPEYQTISS